MKCNKLKNKIKIIVMFVKLKKKGYNKEQRYFEYAIKGLITFEQYEKYLDNKIFKEVKNNKWINK